MSLWKPDGTDAVAVVVVVVFVDSVNGVNSAGSVGSVGSVGGVNSAGSVGSVGSVGGVGRGALVNAAAGFAGHVAGKYTSSRLENLQRRDPTLGGRVRGGGGRIVSGRVGKVATQAAHTFFTSATEGLSGSRHRGAYESLDELE
ncbi:hypothetical protein AX17_004283 [Amanita inopinata Kibby_2008]|nr:hypothetical protein AX17_004283 [Amanita inopinata Kibby_2008]